MERTQGIGKLKEAEKQANDIIEQARKDRIKRTKEAEQKARGDIEKFKAELAAEFAKFTASAGGDSEATFAKLRTTTEKSIVELQASAQKNKDKVTQQLLKYVGEVHTEVHPNILVAQKLGLLK